MDQFGCRRTPPQRPFGFMAGLLLMILAQTALAGGNGDSTRIVLWNRNYDETATRALVELALKESRPLYGDYSLVSSVKMTQARAVRDVQMGRRKTVRLIDVATNPTREKELRAIPIPTQEGLTGYRVCLIAKGTASEFAGIKSYKGITAHGIVFGQGSDWPDTQILRANGLRVVSQSRFQTLFPMLERHRFNCFPRSVTEVLDDLRRYGGNGIEVEPHLLFTYPLPSFFFVNRDDKRLAARIELGLDRAHRDGQYKAYFAHYIQPVLDKLHLSQRTVIRLNNPNLTPRSMHIAAQADIATDRRLEIY